MRSLFWMYEYIQRTQKKGHTSTVHCKYLLQQPRLILFDLGSMAQAMLAQMMEKGVDSHLFDHSITKNTITTRLVKMPADCSGVCTVFFLLSTPVNLKYEYMRAFSNELIQQYVRLLQAPVHRLASRLALRPALDPRRPPRAQGSRSWRPVRGQPVRYASQDQAPSPYLGQQQRTRPQPPLLRRRRPRHRVTDSMKRLSMSASGRTTSTARATRHPLSRTIRPSRIALRCTM